MPIRVCFVCSGNICRSPTAEVVLLRQAAGAGLSGLVAADSAGIGGWHAGDDMDRRSRATLEAAGYAHPTHRAKQFEPWLFDDRDLVVAMDAGHRDALWWLAAETVDTAAAREKIVMLRAFDPTADPADLDVPDPYYGGAEGFDLVLGQVERACAGLLAAITERLGLRLGDQQADRPPL